MAKVTFTQVKKMDWHTGKPEGRWTPSFTCDNAEVLNKLIEIADCDPHFHDRTRVEAVRAIARNPKSYGIEEDIIIVGQ